MHDEMAQIADKVRGITAEKRRDQVAVAAILGLSRQAVSSRYTAKVPFLANELLRLSRELDVPIERFYPAHSSQLAAAQALAEAEASA